MSHVGAGCWPAIMFFVAMTAPTLIADAKYAVGDQVLSKISYKSKTGNGQVVTGDRGAIVELTTKGSKTHAICDFANFASAKLKISDIGLIGEDAHNGWRVGDEIVSGLSYEVSGFTSDGRRTFEQLTKGDPGMVLGAWNETHLHCSFKTIRQKVALLPRDVHVRVSTKPLQLLCAVLTAICLGVPAVLWLWRLVQEFFASLKRLPGGWGIGDEVVLLDDISVFELKRGDVGVVVGKVKVDPAKKIAIDFKSVRVAMDISRIQTFDDYMKGMDICMKASEHIKKEQRLAQKEVRRSLQGQASAADLEVEEPFLCKICYGLLLEPATLLCGHTSCKGCLEAWKATCKNQFTTPCCSKVLPYKLVVRQHMIKDIEKLYPTQLSIRHAEQAELLAQQAANKANKAEPSSPPNVPIFWRPLPPAPEGVPEDANIGEVLDAIVDAPRIERQLSE